MLLLSYFHGSKSKDIDEFLPVGKTYWMLQVVWQIYQSFEKRKKKSVSFSWTIILITAPIVWMKLKKKYWWCPVVFHSSLWKKLDFLLHVFIWKYAWSVLRITDHHCLWVSYLPKYLHTGKTFKYHHFILLFPCGYCIHNQSIY